MIHKLEEKREIILAREEQLRDEKDKLCKLEADNSKLQIEVEELRRLVAAGRDPMIEEIDDEGNQSLARRQVRARPGSRMTKKKERKVVRMAARGHDDETGLGHVQEGVEQVEQEAICLE